MNDKYFNQTYNTHEKNLRQTEPYAFQRKRARPGFHSMPSQPNTYQPNSKPKRVGWGMSTRDYWSAIFKEYLARRGR